MAQQHGHAYNPSTLAIWWVLGQLELHSKTLHQKQVQEVKIHDSLSSVPSTQVVEGENQLYKLFTRTRMHTCEHMHARMCTLYTHMHKLIYNNNKNKTNCLLLKSECWGFGFLNM